MGKFNWTEEFEQGLLNVERVEFDEEPLKGLVVYLVDKILMNSKTYACLINEDSTVFCFQEITEFCESGYQFKSITNNSLLKKLRIRFFLRLVFRKALVYKRLN